MSPRVTKALIKPDGSPCRTDTETADVFGEHFRKLYSATGAHDEAVLGLLRDSPVSTGLDVDPSLEEVRGALRSLSAGKAAGASTITPDALRVLLDDDANLLEFHGTILDFWNSPDPFSDVFGDGILKLIPKKGDLSGPSNYRGIMLLEVPAKVIGRIIASRLTGLLRRDGNGLEEQCGFMPERGCPDAYSALKQALKKRKEHSLDSWVLFIDLVKAFDTVPHSALWAVLRRRGIPAKLLGRIVALHTDVKVKLPVGDASASFDYTIGVKQGDSLAPVLFIFYIQAVLETLDRSSWTTPRFRFKMDDRLNGRSWRARGTEFDLRYSVYADDTALVFESRADLERAASVLRSHFSRWGLSIHVGSSTKRSKTEAMLVPGPRADYADFDTSDVILPDGARIHFTQKFRYLGVVLSHSINDLADVDSRVTAASGAFASLSSIFLSSRVKPDAKRAAYVGLVLPILLYGSESWSLTEACRKLIIR